MAENLNERQAFEEYPDLSASIEFGANLWMTTGPSWNKHLEAINNLCAELSKQKAAAKELVEVLKIVRSLSKSNDDGNESLRGYIDDILQSYI